MDDLPQRVVDAPVTSVTGVWLRHCAGRYAPSALEGRTGDARWGTADGFPVLYLGSPLDSVVVEAYRWLVDPFMEPEYRAKMAAGIHGRVLVHARVDVTNILDLRTAGARLLAGLTSDILTCDINDEDGYSACRRVAQVAHQLGRHGILAPAATGLGNTLALFPNRLPVVERPTREREDISWAQLPADPRLPREPGLRIVTPDDRN